MGFLSKAVGVLTGSDEAAHQLRQAGGAAEQARRWALGELWGARDRAVEMQKPFRDIGLAAIPQVKSLMFGGDYDVEMSPLYQLQKEETIDAINRAAAARGEFGATPTVERIGEATRRVAASETDKMFNRLIGLIDIGRSATTQATSSIMQTGGAAANVYQGEGAQQSDLFKQRASMFTEFSPLNLIGDIAGSAANVFASTRGLGGSSPSTSMPLTTVGQSGYFNPRLFAR